MEYSRISGQNVHLKTQPKATNARTSREEKNTRASKRRIRIHKYNHSFHLLHTQIEEKNVVHLVGSV